MMNKKIKDIINMPLTLCKHNSIPCYFDGADEGCVICIKNQAIEEIGNIKVESVEAKDIANKIIFALNQYGGGFGKTSKRIIENVLKESKEFIILKIKKERTE